MRVAVILGMLLAAASGHANQEARPAQGVTSPAGDAMVEVYWKLVAVGTATPQEGSGDRAPYLRFHSDGSVAGWDGCNTIRASYTAGDTALKLGVMMGTLMTCSVPEQLDRRLREALVLTRTWAIADGHLTLSDERGVEVARFEARLER